MSGLSSWVQDHLGWLLLGLGFIVVMALSALFQRVSMPWLVRHAKDSRWRAAGAALVFHAVLLIGWLLAAVLARGVAEIAGSTAAAAWVIVPAVLVLLAWSLPMVPQPNSTPLSWIRGEMEDRGASTDVSLVVALTSAPFAWVELSCAVVTPFAFM